MKKYLLGLFAIVLAIGFSAFKTKPFTNYTFTRVSGADRSEIASDYQYQPSGSCATNTSKTCTALWSHTGGTPAQGASPNGTFQSVSTNGDFSFSQP